ncbi:EamA family transporter RarD [Pseudoclavibacter sp. CFCC 13796]|uniref:EamA family transporter RarD n=1 Tax=Pseudoclavibacter sp. CFCC 13796 TaxID=2615179 RepID=UPI001CE3EE91|nr:EamA family transporter RarD [Pseudoclavibacter sp. CFCC 13796]
MAPHSSPETATGPIALPEGVDGSKRLSRQPRRSGLMLGIGTYLIWGSLPLYFVLMSPTGPFELVAARVVFSAVFCALLVTATRQWRHLIALFRDARVLLTLTAAALLIYANWQLYVIAVTTEHVLEASLGYFINPIVTILLAVFVQHDRLGRMQWIAVALSAVAVVVLVAAYGQMPWIGLGLAFSFGFYGLIKSKVGERVDAISGLTIETTLLLPVAVVVLLLVEFVGTGLTFGRTGLGHSLLLASAGVVTAVPLITFAAASRRLPLSWIGFLQYLGPTLQFVIGVTVLHEPMPASRLIGFMLIWASIVLLIIDGLMQGRRHRIARLRARA